MSTIYRLCFIALVLIGNTCYAQPKSFHKMSETELRMLPPFCQVWYKGYRLSSAADVQKFKQWQARLGGIPDSQHLCPGLNALNYAYTKAKGPSKGYALQSATNELSYVLKRNKSFPIRSTVLLKRGTAYEEWGKTNEAMADYHEALKLKPNKTHAYIAIAKLQMKLKNNKEARKYIETGLKIKPNSKVLLRLKKRLNK